MNKIMVIAAHPDDEILGCGATIAKHISENDQVLTLILGTGWTSRKDVTEVDTKLESLKNDITLANNIIGVTQIITKDFPDNSFDSVPLLEIIHSIETVMGEFKPTIIYTHHHADVNIDHRRVSEAVQAATRPTPESIIKKVLAFEVPSSSEWSFRKTTMFSPNYFVDTSKFIELKIEALKKYSSEIRDFPHPRSAEYIQALAKTRGGQVGYTSAEAFELVYSR